MDMWQFLLGMAPSAYHHSEVEPMEVDEVCGIGFPETVSAHKPLDIYGSFHGSGRKEVSPVQEHSQGDFPVSWTRMNPGTTALAVIVEPNTEEYIKVAFEFMSSMTYPESDVVNIFRIQNPFLWQHYTLKRQEMVEENGGIEVLEKQLFHGTKCSNIDAICKKGFDWRVCGRHGTKYGQGCYFARNSKYSHIYSFKSHSSRDHSEILRSAVMVGPAVPPISMACGRMDCTSNPSSSWTQHRHSHHQMPQQSTHSSFGSSSAHSDTMQMVLPFQPAKFTSSVHVHSPNQSAECVMSQPLQTHSFGQSSNSRYMFLARVLVGKMVRGHSDYRRPPSLDPGNPLARHYDSCVDSLPHPSIFVIFDSNQLYPEYIVEYKYMDKKN